ncbi:MAG: bifunctional phosphopantothenoylcysteine decarboxylase/phosphopantothenate--cysteine ligase CoaBC [Helicobacteraceae bacterium]|jgi:phosphopantothenoylcysteine decarboxylase/phosphopantothenate--cysteine ligase|nr:bifunctional phosphopantothenoylcysteine decarboxylase/phosphopantothenate--cysteine ligase CoaBC [Helicobacteraceae bacterium]
MNNFSPLRDKKILIGVSGGVAAYKAAILARLFIKNGANVRVVMTPAAEKFVGALTFEALAGNLVLREGAERWDAGLSHIGYAKWADILVVAPATANTIAKLAGGIADNLLLQTALACAAPKILAPAANDEMLAKPAIKRAVTSLIDDGFVIAGAEIGELACGDTGEGRMAEPEKIVALAARVLSARDFWRDRLVIVSGGASIEKIDSVRGVTNFSSGKMAAAMAIAAYIFGAKAVFIGNTTNQELSNQNLPIKYISARSVAEFDENLRSQIANNKGKKAVLIMAAAISDYAPENIAQGKLKKNDIGDRFNLTLTKTKDILLNLPKDDIFCVGFKAETDQNSARENAQKMLKEKGLNAVCLNVIGASGVEFGGDRTKIEFFGKNNYIFEGEKRSVAYEILTALENEA